MQIWVDADACPGAIREILFRAAQKRAVTVTLVANQAIRLPPSPHLKMVCVPAGFDMADQRIAEAMQAGDLVVTADIPLAAQVIDRGGVALNPRGQLYTPENMRQQLSLRNFMSELRDSGVRTGGPATLSPRERQQFANQLDAWLTRRAGNG
ncbi:MAG TPA: YaiI/YqxD family protein [Pseudomonadales bacterium]|nr:YaiI/YqxD family protein [Pseudomonadales bacterium]